MVRSFDPSIIVLTLHQSAEITDGFIDDPSQALTEAQFVQVHHSKNFVWQDHLWVILFVLFHPLHF